MTDYRVIYEDPDDLDAPVHILVPSDQWMQTAMSGGLPIISIWWALQDAEQAAIDEGRHRSFRHSEEMLDAQINGPRAGKLTEEQAIEYLIMKDIPRRVWGQNHNRPMFKIVLKQNIPTNRQFRNAWRMSL